MAYSLSPTVSAVFRVESVVLTLYRALHPSGGLMHVCIDGDCQDVNNYSASTLLKQPAPLGVGRHEQTHSSIFFTGNWVTYSSSGPSGGSEKYTGDTAASIWFQFEGTQLTLYRIKHPSFGTMHVCIDGDCGAPFQPVAAQLPHKPGSRLPCWNLFWRLVPGCTMR